VADCVRSIREKTTYPKYEILVAHNGRINPEVTGLHYPAAGPFNLAHKWNWLIDRARGDYLVLLNDDTLVIEPDWIQNLLEFAVLPDVGVVGPKLLFPDGRIQHAGIVFGLATLCGHVFMGHPHDCPATAYPREFSAVTAGCMMVRKGTRLDEDLPGTFDVDACLQARKRGLKVVYTPHAKLFHLESATFRLAGPAYFEELKRFRRKWPDCIPDPFYTPDRADCVHPV
jgi:GT2 family glycosyltransferase